MDTQIIARPADVFTLTDHADAALSAQTADLPLTAQEQYLLHGLARTRPDIAEIVAHAVELAREEGVRHG